MKIKKHEMRKLIRAHAGRLSSIAVFARCHRTTVARHIAADPDLAQLLELERHKRRERRVRELHKAAGDRAREHVEAFERKHRRIDDARGQLARELAKLSYGQIRASERALERELEALRPLRAGANRARKRLAWLEAQID